MKIEIIKAQIEIQQLAKTLIKIVLLPIIFPNNPPPQKTFKMNKNQVMKMTTTLKIKLMKLKMKPTKKQTTKNFFIISKKCKF